MIMEYKGSKPKISKNVFIAQSADLIGDIKIGAESSIWFGCVIRADVHSIYIGSNTNIQDLSMVHVEHFTKKDRSDGHSTYIGDNVTVGHMVMLHGCTIGNACLIGMSSTIMNGAIIGKESIVAAGSLVTQNKIFPPRSLIMGSPAVAIRELNEDEVQSIYLSAQNYVAYKDTYL